MTITRRSSPSVDEQELIPYAATDLCGARVLVLAPHPDDETIGCGGSLALHRGAGDAVRVVFVTSGELGGSAPDDGTPLAVRREAEAASALAVLGITDWVFWREPDRSVVFGRTLVKRLEEEIGRFAPTLVYAPSPLDLHPDHRAVAGGVRNALLRPSRRLRVAFYETTFAGPVNTLVDIGPVLSSKEAALMAYESQLAEPHDYRAATSGLARFRALTLGRPAVAAEGLHLVDAHELDNHRIWRWQALQQRSPRAPGAWLRSKVLAGGRAPRR